jgi:hypothetical protein
VTMGRSEQLCPFRLQIKCGPANNDRAGFLLYRYLFTALLVYFAS